MQLVIEGRFPRIARIEQEWFEDVPDPVMATKQLQNARSGADIFTFWQRFPDCNPQYNYFMEHDAIAVLPIKSYPFWLEKQIEPSVRNKVRKAAKNGVTVKLTDFSDDFVRGMVGIFNETPVRQGRRFIHYGKDFDMVKKQFSRYLFREEIIGAYLKDELIGFLMIGYSENYAAIGQIISKIDHRNIAPTNALLAKCVERCAEKGVAHLAYAFWLDDSLGDFKRANGFQKVDLPRYFIPLNQLGRISLKTGLHKGIKAAIPNQIVSPLKRVRKFWSEKTSSLRA